MALDVKIARLSTPDLDQTAAVLDAAFGRTGMIVSLGRGFSLQPENWFCAQRDGRIVAVVGAYDYGPMASIGLMGVHPTVQRQGVGQKLMAALLEHLDGRSCPVQFLDASAAGQHLYPGFGFVPEGDTLRVVRLGVVPAAPAPTAEPMGRQAGAEVEVAALEARDLDEVITFDAPLFGADRGAVISACWSAQRGRAFVARDAAGRIVGYFIADMGHIGPWIAASRDAAQRLLVVGLALPYARPPMSTCPARNTSAVSLLERSGFVVTERLLHMRRGGSRDPRQTGSLYAQASLSLG